MQGRCASRVPRHASRPRPPRSGRRRRYWVNTPMRYSRKRGSQPRRSTRCAPKASSLSPWPGLPALAEVTAFEATSLAKACSALQCLRAECAAARLDRDLARTFGASFRRRIRWRLMVEPLNQRVHWKHDEVIDRRRDQDEGNHRVDEISDWELAVVDFKCNCAEIRFSDDCRNHRCEQVLHESGHHGPERRADYDSHRHVHDVPAQEKLFETAHDLPPRSNSTVEAL